MIKSMTGFGKSQVELPDKTVSIEIKSLNSKQLDMSLRTPPLYRDKDMDIRSMLAQLLERGKIDLIISIESKHEDTAVSLNKSLALNYYEQLKDLAQSVPGIKETDYLSIIVRMPDVLKAEKDELSEEEWLIINQGIRDTIAALNEFRKHEGAILEEDMLTRISTILDLLNEVEPLEKSRIRALRERITSQLNELRADTGFEPNRFEQEMIYYLEKMDITEEKVRLKKHCDYFKATLHDAESNGKKLGFIVQEIGREINTLGSKANDAEMQKLVIQMKDELEKIKEQLANIL